MASSDVAEGRILQGYRQLADQLRHEETLSWKRLETFLVVSSALVAIIGLFWANATPGPGLLGLSLIGAAIAFVGLLLSCCWIVVVRRSEAFHDFRYVQLIEMEESCLAPLGIFSLADAFFSGEEVSILGETRRIKGIAKIARIYSIMTAVPVIFAAMWSLLLLSFLVIGVASLLGA